MRSVICSTVFALAASCACFAQNRPVHYVFFGQQREIIRNASFLERPIIAGAQICYTWRSLEPQPDRYDFSAIEEDRAFLDARGKKLFVQLQDVTFEDRVVNFPCPSLDIGS